MKRLIAVIIAMILVFSTVCTVSAEIADVIHTQGNVPNSSTVQHGVRESYVAIIPPQLTLSPTSSISTEVGFTEVYLTRAQTLTMIVDGANYIGGKWYVISDDNNKTHVSYAVNKGAADGDAVNDGDAIIVYNGNSATGEAGTTLYFTVTGEIVQSGNYTDTLTFKVFVN